ncbi:hypothetical protein [Hyalangium versicolor]|uniref:hypothetical protein n=1 Tax=Hyalangium versicolor TaxID=2861190 RepID=UPI001CCBFEC6|nr:hypothetical protein [Hyalangium versicolor]
MPFVSLLRSITLIQAIGVIVALALLAMGLVWWRWLRLSRAIRALDTNLTDLLSGQREEPDSSELGRSLWRAVREQLVFPPGRQQLPGPVLMRSSPSQALRESCRSLFRHSAGHGFGKNLTGIALVLTFSLLGVVLVGPVQEALASNGTRTDSQSSLLSQAIGQMGAKFFVSAAGLVLSFLFQWVASALEGRLLARLDAMRTGFERNTQTLEAHEIALASARKDALGELKGELSQTRRELSERLEQLESVNVCIQDIGTQVQAHFGTMMKEHVGDVITRQLTSVERAVREIAAELQRSIASGFAATLQKEMSTVRAHLEAMNKVLSERQEHDLGRIIEQLRDTVSGGFQSQSRDMARQMEELVNVLPRLEHQFETMSQMMGSNARQWGSENQRTIDALGEKVSALVGSFDKVRDGLETAVARVLKASTESSHRLGLENQQVLGQLQGTVQEVLSEMKESSRQLMNAASRSAQELQMHTERQAGTLNHQVEALRAAAAMDMSSVQAKSKEFAATMGTTQEGLRKLTEQLSVAASQLVSATREVERNQGNSEKLSVRMDEVANRLISAASSFNQLSEERKKVIEREESLLSVQRQALDRVDPVLKGLTRTYEESVSRQAQTLSGHWTTVTEQLSAVVGRTSGELLQGVEDLTEVVEDLKKTLQPQARRT